jgi:hypothetical protein
MARQAGTVVENNFIKGLVTETTALAFPENSCTEALNVDFDLTGRITKRRGLDLETSFKNITTVTAGTDAFSEYVWRSVGGDGNRTFFVQQKGRYIYFYDVSDSSDISGSKLSTVLDLDTYKPSSTDQVPSIYPCGYTAGNGDLIIVNQAIDPVYVTYTASTGAIAATEIEIQVRDFRGLNDGLAIDGRPTATVATLISGNPAHYYNLANQGWLTGDALTQWDTALTTMPSNSDYIGLFRSSATDAFDAAIVTSKTGYNTPAPKGHYVLNAWQPDRTLGGTLTFSGTVSFPSLINDSGLSRIGSNQSSLLYDGVTSTSVGGSHSSIASNTQWMGNNLGSAKKISKVVVYGTNNGGFSRGCSTGKISICGQGNGSFSHSMYLYGKTSAPASATDGTLLGQVHFSDQSDQTGGKEISSTDTTNTYQYVWVYHVWNNYATFNDSCCTRTLFCSELDTYEYVVTSAASSDDIVTFKRPTTTEFYQGRVFYSGVVEQNLGSNIYFSQIAEKRDQYGYCYQKNDPTSEDVPDLLADDGGLIKIPDAGNILRLFEFQGALLVLATNGVWIVQGSAGGPFLATDYEVKKISASGTNSPLSIASFRGVPVWWGREGIMTVQFDPNYSSFAVQNLTNTTIQNLVDDIPNVNKKFVKGTCDPVDRIIYWLYNDSANLETADNYKYNMMMCLNMQTGAFFPYDLTGMDVRGIQWIPDNAVNANPAKLKFVVSEEVAGTADSSSYELVTFADLNEDEWTDWATYAEGHEAAVSWGALTTFEDATSNEAAAYDGTVSTAAAAATTKTSATSIYYGFTFAADAAITRAHVWGTSDAGYVTGANPTITMRLYGKTGTAPANGTDGTVLAEITFTDTANESATRRDLISNNNVDLFDHCWVYISQGGAAASMYIAQIEFFTRTADAADELEYEAYFTTGYRLDGETQRYFQTNYVMVFLESQTDASLFGQGVFDFTNTANSGRWSTLQQLYNPNQDDTQQDVVYRRLKCRGKGRAVQLRFEGDPGAPFTVIGWNIWATSNASV